MDHLRRALGTLVVLAPFLALLIYLGSLRGLAGAAPPRTEAAETAALDAERRLAAPDERAEPAAATPPELAELSFQVRFKDEITSLPVLGVFVMPGEVVNFDVVLADSAGATFTLAAAGGHADRTGAGHWRWTAPETKGFHPVRITRAGTRETMTLNVFVLVPVGSGALLNGYRIGRYRATPLRGDPAYTPPAGFVEVTDATRDVLVAPHFTLGQFASKQSAGYPRYLVLRERLLLKLEGLLREFRAHGIPATTLRVMSGYRTPFYNESIGNETSYSRHLYGDAADVYVDENGDGRMDDLDGDGRVTIDDARVLYRIVEGMSGRPAYVPFEGGLGLYGPAPHRGPFIHVDARGSAARWTI